MANEIEFRDVLDSEQVDTETSNAVRRGKIDIASVEDMETDGDGLHYLNNRGVYREITGEGLGDMNRSTYDQNINGVVDNAELVNGLTVDKAVPVDALFTDTVYDDTNVDNHMGSENNPHNTTYDNIMGTQPAPVAHTHVEADITDLEHYTDADADARIQDAISDTSVSLFTMYSSTKIESLIDSSLIYQGTWNADTNIPTLSDGVGTAGYFYTVSVGGTVDLGSGSIDFIIGDKIVYSGTVWEKSAESNTALWGSIYGTLSDQSDLQGELDDKSNIGHVHVEANITDLDKYTKSEVDTNVGVVQSDIDGHQANVANPHVVTKAQVGLPNVPDSIAQDLLDHETDFTNPHLTVISNLGDTDTVTRVPSEGMRLAYNEVTQKWEPRNSTSGLGYVTFDYRFSTSITDTPSSGDMQLNNADPSLATEIYIHHTDDNGDEQDAYWDEIKENDWFNIYQSNNTAVRYQYDITGPGVQVGDIWTFPISYYVHAGTIANNTKVKLLWRISGTQVIDNLTSVRTDYALSANQGRVLNEKKVEWKGPWVNATYYKSDMVRDGAYTSVVVVPSTNERPAPQDIGLPYNVYSGTLNSVQNMASQIIFGTRYVAGVAVKIIGYRVDVIAGNEYAVYSVIDPLGSAIASLESNFTADISGWVDISTSEIIIGNGFTFDMAVYVQEPDGTPTVAVLDYAYDTPNNSSTPASGQIQHSNSSPENLLVNKTDNNSNDNSVFLEGLHVGDIIELNTIRWSIQSVADSGTYMTYQINPTVQYGPDGVYAVNFETIEATPITVGREIDANIATNQSGLYIADGKYGDIVPDNNQYGADILIQEISISADYEIVATSASTGGGSEGGTTVEVVDNLTTQDSTKALSANQGYVLDNAKVANGRVLTDVPGGAVFTDTVNFLADTNSVLTGSFTEEVYANSGTALEPDNGTIQTQALTGNITFTDGLSSGQSMTLILLNGSSYTVTYPSITWSGDVPVLTDSDTLVFWKVSTTLYGTYVGANA